MKIVYTGEMDPRLCKEVLGATIEKIVTEDENTIYLDADLMSCCGTLKWAKQNPERAIDCGIAESNMAGVAAGLAVAGYRPIIHSFGPFASRRCYDQIFLSGGYGKNDITVIGTDPGVTAAMNGGTHMPFEDVALYSVLPGSTVIDVSDPTCLESVLRQCSASIARGSSTSGWAASSWPGSMKMGQSCPSARPSPCGKAPTR